jgi:hypothetical protein
VREGKKRRRRFAGADPESCVIRTGRRGASAGIVERGQAPPLPTPQGRPASASEVVLLDEHMCSSAVCLPAALAGIQYGVLTFLAEKGIDETALLAGTIADEGKWLCIIPRKRVHA